MPEMLKLCRVTEVKVFFLVLVYVFNFNLFEFLAAILDNGLLMRLQEDFRHDFESFALVPFLSRLGQAQTPYFK